MTIIRFAGLKALPVFSEKGKQKAKFFDKAIALVREGQYWHMDMMDRPDDATPFDESENDTKLTLNIDHYDIRFAIGLRGSERMVYYLETLRDAEGTVEDFDDVDYNNYGGNRRYISLSVKITMPELPEAHQ